MLFINGPVYTMDTPYTRHTAVAVTAGRISALGDRAIAARRQSTEVINLGGRAVLPGFIDAHVHPVVAGVEGQQVDLTSATTIKECLEMVGAYAHANPSREWITGGGWSMELFDGGVPSRQLLDDVAPDRPVYLTNRDHHGAWVNSCALQRASIDSDTLDPADGRIECDNSGTPTGVLQEGAMSLVAQHIPPLTAQEKLSGLLTAQRLLHSYGITGWQDALLGESPLMPDVTSAYLDAIASEQLTAKVVGALWWDRTRGTEQIEELCQLRELHRQIGFDTSTVKIMQDGIAENFTAAMIEPYFDCCGHQTQNRGLSFVDPNLLCQYVTALDQLDFQVHFHALGDRAVREALDAIEAARRANGWSGNRHQLAHLQVVAPADIPRFQQWNAAANIQPLWATHEPQMDELTIPFLGTDRAAQQYPFAALAHSGAVLAAGSDWPVSSPNPWEAIHVAVTRQAVGTTEGPFLPEQRIGLGTAITAYTAGSAYLNRQDDTGAIRTWNAADLVVLNRDPFTTPIDEIGHTTVDMTFINGKCVHEKAH
ncbi:N-substituted formamide deformylase precursor [Mycobacteroides salmoniphilum]|uniref:N-substituted formamide deformylase n=1 Tax=Mycobacteroides salmoniphilum TaxID=404941 RepID=A0A4R8S4Z5_9MYCO|nr:N-substituted formamide deformylase precursor [Mycobacteroides salmoniphilum]